MPTEVKVTYEDGNVIHSKMNCTFKEAKKYYLNNWFQFGDTEEHPGDLMLRAIKVEDITPSPGKIRIWQLCYEEYLFPRANYYNPVLAIRKLDSVNMSTMVTKTMVHELSREHIQIKIDGCGGHRWINAHQARVKMVCK